jgi:hypothetical protein
MLSASRQQEIQSQQTAAAPAYFEEGSVKCRRSHDDELCLNGDDQGMTVLARGSVACEMIHCEQG